MTHYPRISSGFHDRSLVPILYSWVERERERETGRLKCLTQEHSTVTLQGLARLQERIAKMKAKIVNKALNGSEWH